MNKVTKSENKCLNKFDIMQPHHWAKRSESTFWRYKCTRCGLKRRHPDTWEYSDSKEHHEPKN